MSGDLATSLREVWSAKKNLRWVLRVPKNIPFVKYVDYFVWLGTDIIYHGSILDFLNDRYSLEGVPCSLGDVATFLRDFPTTIEVDGEEKTFEVGEPSIVKGKGMFFQDGVEGDSLKITLLPNQTLVMDGDSGVELTLEGDVVTFKGVGWVRYIEVFSPEGLSEEFKKRFDFTMNFTWPSQT